MSNTKPIFDSPDTSWRKSFAFKPAYPNVDKQFKLDPLLVKYSTNASLHNLQPSVHTKK